MRNTSAHTGLDFVHRTAATTPNHQQHAKRFGGMSTDIRTIIMALQQVKQWRNCVDGVRISQCPSREFSSIYGI